MFSFMFYLFLRNTVRKHDNYVLQNKVLFVKKYFIDKNSFFLINLEENTVINNIFFFKLFLFH